MGKVLIIDDDPDIRELVSVFLEGAGHSVSQAEDGQDGINKASTTRPDLIILDVNMPVMDGIEVMKFLRTTPKTTDIPVIALSAVDVSQIRDDMHQLGCGAYVVKPIDFDILMGTVRNLIRH
ncbi:MAG: response regulator [Magnetovibrio sp.]|nr:response regulator [Magnetovibrio sp.]